MKPYKDKITQQHIEPVDATLSREYDNTISMGSMQYIIIEKLYGAFVFNDLRITCNSYRGGWVIERIEDYPEGCKSDYVRKWSEVAFIKE
jgi:hypothetical protein